MKFSFSFILLFAMTLGCHGPALLHQVAQPAVLPPGAPRYSDVCFSSRWEHPCDAGDTLETFSAARSFHATSIQWVYTTNAAFIRRADSLGMPVQVALSPTLPDEPGGETRQRGRMRNARQEPVTAPWMKGWGYWWGCVNHPDFRALWLRYMRLALEAGAAGFQVDDPAFGVVLLRNKWEDVCYCIHCQRIADSLGVKPPDIQEASVVDFYHWARRQAQAIAGRPVPFSCNNFRGEWELFPFDLFDFGVAELPERRANPEYIYATLRETRRRHKAQVFSFANDREFLVQKVIATTYACGGNPLVPWDVWMGTGRDRYYGTPQQYAPLFGFARGIAQWLDGYEDAFYATTQDEFRYHDVSRLPMHFVEYRRQIHAFARAKPGDARAPVVIHLVDWEVLTQPFSLHLLERAFFKKGIDRVEMLFPLPYDSIAHERAAQTGDYSILVGRQELPFERSGREVRLRIPAIEHHWVVLVVF